VEEEEKEEKKKKNKKKKKRTRRKINLYHVTSKCVTKCYKRGNIK